MSFAGVALAGIALLTALVADDGTTPRAGALPAEVDTASRGTVTTAPDSGTSSDAATPVAIERTPNRRAIEGPARDALAGLSFADRSTIETVAQVLERPANDLATWAVRWDAVADLRDLHALLDDDGGRPHMRSALEAYMELREQVPTAAGS